MNARFFPLLFFVLATTTCLAPRGARADADEIVLVIHGGAGTLTPETMTSELEAEYHEALATALQTGFEILARGGTALDAVEATIRTMEDSPLFNAGRGSVFTSEGRNEFDAAIMDGATRRAGAVAAVTGIKNPIAAARRVMEKTKHVMLVGKGAEQFARQQKLEFADSAYFFTQRRWDALQKAKKATKKSEGSQSGMIDIAADGKFGTVGAVALDASGNIAAATSTGGTTNKRWGRVGDSPIIGAGTYADRVCGVSGTGTGEIFIRAVAAFRVAAMMEFQSMSLEEAVDIVVHEELVAVGGPECGGLIALDADGNIAMSFNTLGMYRGFIRADGEARTFIYR